ncbi:MULTISPECIES: cupin domain-containing protein [unclassified Mesorhizobium]|uniref:cupin domain-containing protein n=1 Tax=unclassified Mesorhizobium TaxID=325217 RepID=UPI000414A936|nr:MULTISPECIES: cupin domain-containing protein [unclassified Mesorhizobium]WJI46864.1 cupin domain-containing protein [Mesorhizobium sp. C120A]WJI83281.1 cupin domain-containing protein [Mesorhizobium sp. C374B]WJI89806.1 cupin domain-containing protein [Mesorhizobium sp. C372A]
MELDLIDLSTFRDLAKAEIGAFSPKPTSIEGDQVEAVRSFFQSPDGTVDVGIWECTPGRFTADRSDSSEICHIISGRVELSRIDGEVRELGPGDLLVLPQGWKGEWLIRETTRKLYMIQSAG